MTVKVLLEGLVRLAESGVTREENIGALAAWPAPPPAGAELPFLPARVLMQDFTGVPAVVDLAVESQDLDGVRLSALDRRLSRTT